MVARLKLDAHALWAEYQKLGSLRAVSRATGIGHMVIRNHLVNAGYKIVPKGVSAQSLQPTSKVYLRPGHIEGLKKLAARKGMTSIHELARQLLATALNKELPGWNNPDN